jgi:hypothetical protein
MTSFRFSILLRFTLFIGVFIVIILGSAAATVVALKVVNRNADEITEKWLVGAMLLSDIDYHVSAFRITEIYHALAPNQKTRAAADADADTHRRGIADLENQYVTLLGDRLPSGALDSYRDAWKDYQAEHDAWVKADSDGAIDEPANFDSALGRNFQNTDKAVDHLFDVQQDNARARGDAITQITDQSTIVAGAISTAAILLSIALMFGIRSQITRPLAGITRTLSKVAAGSREIEVLRGVPSHDAGAGAV